MKRLVGCIAGAMLAVSSGATAQSLGQGSEGESFLSALEDKDMSKAVPLIEQPGSRLATYRGYKGDTALHIVTRQRNLNWVRFLVSRGADPSVGDKNGDTPLIVAARIGFIEAVDVMLAGRTNPDAANRMGETALIVAVQQRQTRAIERLLEAGANPDKADRAAGLSARDYAKRDTRNPQILRLIETTQSKAKKSVGPTIR